MAAALVRLTADPGPERAAEVRRLAASVDLGQLLDLLAAQRLVSTLGSRLLDDPEIELPDTIAEQIRAARMRSRHRGVFDLGLTKQLTDDLAGEGIAAMPLKGATLAEAAYGDIGARQSTDLDVLVRLGDLDRAVAIAERQGWREPELLRKAGVPSLHREMFHATRPPLELHWRVHWYEDAFADAAMVRAEQTEQGWLRAQPADEIAFLLLFLARDGFTGLRQLLDVAAWWSASGRQGETAAGLRAIADTHPALAPALTAAGRYAERAAGIPAGSLTGDANPSPRGQVAIRLADPWRTGSRAQIAAEMSLADALLAPRRGFPDYVRRQLLIPRWGLVRRQPHLEHASGARLTAARLAHTARVLARYGLASRALLPRRPAKRSGIS
jgi:hypothetical protein